MFRAYGFHRRKGMRFNSVLNALLSTQYTSNTITVRNVPAASAISIVGGTYSKNGGAYTAAAGVISPGDTVNVRRNSSASDLTLVAITLTIGVKVLVYNITTGDHVPSAFSFVDITNAALSTVYISAPITVTGITIPAAISITGGDYRVNGGAFTASAGTVNNSNTVEARVTSSGSNSTAVNAAVTIGGISDTYTVTTLAGGGTPSLDFSNVNNSMYTSLVV